MKKAGIEKIEFTKTHKDLYTATSRIKEVKAEKAAFLSCKGEGEPGGAAYQEAIQQIFTLVYTTKFMLKNAGKLDFGVSRLECLWHGEDFENTPKSQWRWELLMRIPEAVKAGDLKRACVEIKQRREVEITGVKRISFKEGRCLQVMHIGPYEEIGRTYQGLAAHAASLGLKPAGAGHEIYISDPQRVPPARLKTIVRLPVVIEK